MAYDPIIGSCVLLGGFDTTGGLPDEHAWLYDGSSWMKGPPIPASGGVAWSSLTFHAATGKCVLSSGIDLSGNFLDATWEFDGAVWSPGATIPPALGPGALFASAYMDSIDATVVIGGFDAALLPRNDTWHYRECPPIGISPTSLPSGSVGVAYSVALTASGGTPPHTFVVNGGALPPGLTLSSAGVIQGVPAIAGTFGFNVDALDAKGCPGSRAYALTIISTQPKEDLLAGSGGGYSNVNRFRAFTVGGTVTVDVIAYGASHWGVNVAGGQLDGATLEEVLTGPGPGPSLGPQVRGFATDGTPIGKVSYYAYGTLKGGVLVGSGQMDADGAYDEILTGAGPGAVFGPHVRGWNYDNTVVGPIKGMSFFAYQTLKYGGVWLRCWTSLAGSARKDCGFATSGWAIRDGARVKPALGMASAARCPG